ncbi:MAG: hypothetical protein V1912_04720 [bacterium]
MSSCGRGISAIDKGTARKHPQVKTKGTTVSMFILNANVFELTGAMLTSGRMRFIGGTTASAGVQVGFVTTKSGPFTSPYSFKDVAFPDEHSVGFCYHDAGWWHRQERRIT